MLAHHVVSFGALAALLALYSGIYLNAFKGVAIPACVVNTNSLPSFTDFRFLCRVHRSTYTTSVGIGSHLINVFFASVRLHII